MYFVVFLLPGNGAAIATECEIIKADFELPICFTMTRDDIGRRADEQVVDRPAA